MFLKINKKYFFGKTNLFIYFNKLYIFFLNFCLEKNIKKCIIKLSQIANDNGGDL